MSEDKFKEVFSSRLRHFMDIKDIKQTDIVRDLNINSSTVSNWCNGVMFPRPDKLKLLADYLGVTVGTLAFEEIKQEYEEDDELLLVTHLKKRNSIKFLSEILNYDCNDIVEYFLQLNTKGMYEADKRIKELTYIPEYKTDSDYDFSSIVRVTATEEELKQFYSELDN